MEDQLIMNTSLTLTKNICELLLHGSIESQEPKVNKCFRETLSEYVELQDRMYSEMQNQGFYNIETVTESKIGKVKNKHSQDKI